MIGGNFSRMTVILIKNRIFALIQYIICSFSNQFCWEKSKNKFENGGDRPQHPPPKSASARKICKKGLI
jgi:hypothetical protein